MHKEWDICICCNGSGEGMYDGSTCSCCKGSGEILVEVDEQEEEDEEKFEEELEQCECMQKFNVSPSDNVTCICKGE